MLTGHQQGDHHVGNFVVGDRGSVLVGGVHQMLHDVQLGVLLGVGAALLNSLHVDLGDGLLGVVTLAVPGQREPVEHEVDGSEAHVQIVVESSQRHVELLANGTTLERVRGGEDGDLGHVVRDVGNARLALEFGALLEVVGNLARDDGNVGSESLGGESDLHELCLGGRKSVSEAKVGFGDYAPGH